MTEYNVSVVAKVWSLIRNELGLTDILIDAIVNGTLPSRDTAHDGTPLKLFHQKQFEEGIRSHVVCIDNALNNKTRGELDAMEVVEHAALTKPGSPARLTLEDFDNQFKGTVFPDLKMLILNNEVKISCMSPKERQKILESKQLADDETLLSLSTPTTKEKKSSSSKKRKRIDEEKDDGPASKKTSPEQ
jgi:hypothetical protein